MTLFAWVIAAASLTVFLGAFAISETAAATAAPWCTLWFVLAWAWLAHRYERLLP